jgi:hypothetical protein
MQNVASSTSNRLRTGLSLGLAVAALALGGALSAPTASASGTAWNDLWQYLRFPATDNQGRCVYRWIDLAAGTYEWRLFSAHWANTHHTRWTTRRIYLRRSEYRWVDCNSRGGTVFRHDSTLWDEERPFNRAVLSGDYQTGAYGNGSYHWGSSLRLLP